MLGWHIQRRDEALDARACVQDSGARGVHHRAGQSSLAALGGEDRGGVRGRATRSSRPGARCVPAYEVCVQRDPLGGAKPMRTYLIVNITVLLVHLTAVLVLGVYRNLLTAIGGLLIHRVLDARRASTAHCHRSRVY